MRDDITPDETPRRGKHLASNRGDHASTNATDTAPTSAGGAPRHTAVNATPAANVASTDGEPTDARVDTRERGVDQDRTAVTDRDETVGRTTTHDEPLSRTAAREERDGHSTRTSERDGDDHITDDETDDKATKRKGPPLLALILGLSVVVSLMLLAFATPAVKSGAKDMPIAVSGPQQAVSTVQAQLEKRSPGTFDVTTFSSADEAADAIKERDVVGGIALGKDGATIQTASAAGAPYSNVLKGVGAGLEKQGQKVTYTDVVPLPKNDPTGAAMTAAALPLIFGGMATSAAMFFTLRGSTGRRFIGIIGVAAVAGLAASAILHFWLDVMEGSFWLLAASVGMGIAAIAFTVIGLAKNLGQAGFGLGALIMFFLSNPISGIATGPSWLPSPWGAIGQLMPVGAAGTALRSSAYFDGHGATHAWIVLACWALGGALLMALGKARKTTH